MWPCNLKHVFKTFFFFFNIFHSRLNPAKRVSVTYGCVSTLYYCMQAHSRIAAEYFSRVMAYLNIRVLYTHLFQKYRTAKYPYAHYIYAYIECNKLGQTFFPRTEFHCFKINVNVYVLYVQNYQYDNIIYRSFIITYITFNLLFLINSVRIASTTSTWHVWRVWY